MLTWKARETSTELLEQLVSVDSQPTASHPSVSERLARLGEPARLPPPLVRSAGEELLGPALARLADSIDRRWIAENGDTWHRNRAEYLDRRRRLERLMAIEAPSPDQLFARAALLETMDGEDAALPIYQTAANQAHAEASLAVGRLLLARMNAGGIGMIEAAMDRDPRLVPEGCRILAHYYRQTNQELAARKCEWRATRHTTQARLDERTLTPEH
jgi:hypothetical protein